MQRFTLATIALSLLLSASACATNGNQTQTAQQRQACRTGDRHPWCMQMAQTRPLGAAPYGLTEPTESTNPEMRDDNPPYPRNPALPLQTPGINLNIGGIGGGGIGAIGGIR
ncbi:MAG TPA: hypothetical protein VE243_09215 [Candidatus Acidoferrum sp.]|nr:hypothetical protein [Candidatus Acidoferrum sp.]